MKQLEILEGKIKEFQEDKSILGVMVMGSVADGTANEASDLDLMILCDIDKFEAEYIDEILVEYIYMKYDTALYKLQNMDMEVYHYINSKIRYDNGQMQELMLAAIEKFLNFETNAETKKGIYHWLASVKIKLQSALNQNDVLRSNYLTTTNSWELIEAIWAVNDRPMPPSGSVTKFLSEIKLVPYESWFNKLFVGSDFERTQNMLKIIDWVLPKLLIK